jgi:hypothetical protein
MTIAADTTGLHENAQRVLATGIGVADDDNYRRLDDNYEPRQMDITNLATTGRSSCRRPAILVDVDQKSAGATSTKGMAASQTRPIAPTTMPRPGSTASSTRAPATSPPCRGSGATSP